MFHFSNAYDIPVARVFGYVCKTNLPSNTAFRGFGAPQGMFAAEFMIRQISEFLGKDSETISYLNLSKNGDVTHYNQLTEDCTLDRCWNECAASSELSRRKASIENYNKYYYNDVIEKIYR